MNTAEKIELGDGSQVAVLWNVPAKAPEQTLILAHGAGSHMEHPSVADLAARLSHAGVQVVRFNFPYRQAGRRLPDRTPVLLAAWRAVIRHVRSTTDLPLFIGGRSMGGRMASLLVADGEPVSGLLLLGYPLHPAGRPDKLRVVHFPRLDCSVLFVQGTRDRLCRWDLFQEAIAGLPRPPAICVIDQGDHSFGVPKRFGMSEEQVQAQIASAVVSWLREQTGAG